MWSRFASTAILVALVTLVLVPAVGPSSADATSPSVQSSVSVYLACPSRVLLAEPGQSGSCASGNYTGTYTGVSQTVVSNQTSVFYLSAATGGVKVTFSLTDLSTGKLLLSGVGYGSISGGSCASPSLVVPTSTSISQSVINSGDRVMASLNTIFTGTGTPEFCSGGATGTLIQVGTTVVAGKTQPLLTTVLTAGTPYQTTIFGLNGVAVSYLDTTGSGFITVVMGVVTNSSGSTVGVLTNASVTVSPGTSTTAFLPLSEYPSGTYTVTVLAVTSLNVPVSTVGTVKITV